MTPSRKLRWLPLLVLCTALTWPATAALATSSAPTLTVVLSPCSAPTATAPCRVDPAQIQVDLPGDNSVQAVQVSWVADPSRPSPAQQQVLLTVASGPHGPAACQHQVAPPSGFVAACWDWPSTLVYSSSAGTWLLNGTYRVTPCSATSSGTPCTSSTAYDPALAEVAVAPSTPAGVAASQSNGSVTVSWKPGPEPDLVGYTVSRNNQTVYTCSTDGAGPGAATPCTNPPTFHDQPGSGTWSYAVTSLRFGADATAAHVVASSPAPSSVYVPPPPASATGAGSGAGWVPAGGAATGGAFVPALPPMGTLRPASFGGVTGVPGAAVPALANEDSGGAVAAPAGSLSYSDDPALGKPLASGSLVRQQKAANRVDAAAQVAIAVLALALAAHVWYLRGELRAASLRVAARRAASGSTA